MIPFQKKSGKFRILSRNSVVFVVLSSLSFLMVLFSTRPFITNVKELGFSVFSGMRSVVSGVQTYFSNTVHSIRELKDLRDEYHALALQLDRYGNMERENAEVRMENIRLRELLGFSESLAIRHIPGKVTARNPDNLFSSIVVNKGTKHGVRRNMAVIAYNGGMQGLVGKVVQVGRYECLIMPLHDVNAHVTSRLVSSRYEGIVSGQGSVESPLVMNYVKKRARSEINPGDIVSTSGMGGVYPPEIALGRIQNIMAHEYESSLVLELEPVIDFSRLEYVFILDYENRDVPGEGDD